MKRFSLAFALLATAVVSHANVTFKTAGCALGKALLEFGKQNSLAISASGPIAQQIIVINVKDQPLDVFLKRLAEVTSGSWKVTDDRYELTESATAVQAEIAIEQAARAKAFAKALAQQTKDLPEHSPTDNEIYKSLSDLRSFWDQMQNNQEDQGNEVYERVSKMQDLLPTPQLVKRLLLSFAPQDLAALPIETRVVYSNQPNRMQRGFGPGGQKAVTRFAQEYSRMLAALSRFPREQQGQLLSTFGGAVATGAPVKVLLSVVRYTGGSLSADLQVLDRVGNILTTGNSSLSADVFSLGEGQSEPAKPQPGEKPFKVSEESRIYYSLMSRPSDGSKPGFDLVKEPLRTKVLNPEIYDPLSFGISDLFIGASEESQKPLIALVPDSAFMFDASGSLTATQFFRQLGEADWMKVEDKDGWITARPRYPAEARKNRTNRAAYGALVRQIAKAGRISLDDLATFGIAQVTNPGYDSFYVQSLYALFGQALSGYDLTAWESIRFYGLLGPTIRQTLAQNPAALQNLPRDAQIELARLVYKQQNLSSSIEIVDSAVAREVEGQVSSSMGICMDPTERLPNGLPPTTVVKLNSSSEMVAMPQTMSSFPMAANELASQIAMEERPDLFPWAQENRTPDKFKVSTRFFHNFEFEFGSDVGHSIQLWDYRGTDSNLYSRGQLPAGFKDEFEKSLKEMRESYKGMKTQGGTGAGSAPPLR